MTVMYSAHLEKVSRQIMLIHQGHGHREAQTIGKAADSASKKKALLLLLSYNTCSLCGGDCLSHTKWRHCSNNNNNNNKAWMKLLHPDYYLLIIPYIRLTWDEGVEWPQLGATLHTHTYTTLPHHQHMLPVHTHTNGNCHKTYNYIWYVQITIIATWMCVACFVGRTQGDVALYKLCQINVTLYSSKLILTYNLCTLNLRPKTTLEDK